VPYPDRLLAEDEEVVLRLHPHWKVLVLPVLAFLLLAAATGFAIARIDSTAAELAVVVVALLLLYWLTIVPFLRWRTTHFVITTHRVLLRRGILSRSGRDIPLSRVNDVSFQHSLLERMLGCGTLVVESAGERGQVSMDDVPHVEQVQSTLYQLVEDDSDRRGRPDAEPRSRRRGDADDVDDDENNDNINDNDEYDDAPEPDETRRSRRRGR
jgi:uncharacterized membrane protein YdbT with pleckstrin-like domain